MGKSPTIEGVSSGRFNRDGFQLKSYFNIFIRYLEEDIRSLLIKFADHIKIGGVVNKKDRSFLQNWIAL